MDSKRRSSVPTDLWLLTKLVETSAPDTVAVAPWRLKTVSSRTSLLQYIAQLWERRHFILADARAKAFATSRDTMLGKIWLVLRPFLDAFVYFLIFGMLLGTRRGIENFPAYLVVGVNFFTLLNLALSSGGGIVTAARNLLRAFSFPRASIVLSWSLRHLLDFLPVVLTTVVFVIVMPPGVMPNWTMLLIVPITFLGWVFAVGIAFFTASLTYRFKDLKFIWPLLGRVWLYGSGVFFSIDNVVSDPLLSSLMKANPGFHFLSMMRNILVYKTLPALNEWAYMAYWALGTLLIGFLIFWYHEESYGREY
ncbi:MAG: ABC transporter [Actinobacteria bacterium]|nr:MAG: ABC transporter [Actinomycetota bacterium]